MFTASSQVAERGAQRIADRLAALVENGLTTRANRHLVAPSLYPLRVSRITAL